MEDRVPAAVDAAELGTGIGIGSKITIMQTLSCVRNGKDVFVNSNSPN